MTTLKTYSGATLANAITLKFILKIILYFKIFYVILDFIQFSSSDKLTTGA